MNIKTIIKTTGFLLSIVLFTSVNSTTVELKTVTLGSSSDFATELNFNITSTGGGVAPILDSAGDVNVEFNINLEGLVLEGGRVDSAGITGISPYFTAEYDYTTTSVRLLQVAPYPSDLSIAVTIPVTRASRRDVTNLNNNIGYAVSPIVRNSRKDLAILPPEGEFVGILNPQKGTGRNILSATRIVKKTGDANFQLFAIPECLYGCQTTIRSSSRLQQLYTETVVIRSVDSHLTTPTYNIVSGDDIVSINASGTVTIIDGSTGIAVINVSYSSTPDGLTGNSDLRINEQTNIPYTIFISGIDQPEIYGPNTMRFSESINLADQVLNQGTDTAYVNFEKTWTSSNPTIASVDADGLVTANAIGSTIITLEGMATIGTTIGMVNVSREMFVISRDDEARFNVIAYANSNGQSPVPEVADYGSYTDIYKLSISAVHLTGSSASDLPYLNAIASAQPAGSVNAANSFASIIEDGFILFNPDGSVFYSEAPYTGDQIPKPDYGPGSRILTGRHEIGKKAPWRLYIYSSAGYNTGPIRMVMPYGSNNFRISYEPSARKVIGTLAETTAPGLYVENSEWEFTSDDQAQLYTWTYIGNANSPREGRRVLMPNYNSRLNVGAKPFFFYVTPLAFPGVPAASNSLGVYLGLGSGSGDYNSANDNANRLLFGP